MRSETLSGPSSTIELNNGVRMPVIGFGTWRLSGGEGIAAIRAALRSGFRLVDTASMYENEEEVGKAIASSGIAREDIFVTTKLWSHQHGYAEAKKALAGSLKKLGLDRVDLYLIHWPTGGRNVETWRALVELMEEGQARAVGVSNFSMEDIEPLVEATGVTPAVDQVPFGPQGWDGDLLEAARAAVVRVEAYSPLKRTDLRDPELVRIARGHGKSPAQTVIRWVIQKGVVPLIKSSHEARIRENMEVFDFALTDEEMSVLDRLR
jgi:diketogulonate reductase-like aldo/keto reductase